MGDVSRIEITDPFQIRQIVSKLVKSRYVFTRPVLGSRVHSGEYQLGLYSVDGRCIEGVTMLRICCPRFQNVPGNKERRR